MVNRILVERRNTKMNFCNHCGTGNKADAQFCSNCGNTIKTILSEEIQIQHSTNEMVMNEETNTLTISSTSNQTRNSKNSGQNKEKKLIFYFLFIVLIGIFIGGYVLAESKFSKEKVVAEFLEGLSMKNSLLIKKHLYSNDLRIKINDNTIEPLFQLLDKNPSYFDQIKANLEEQLEFNQNSSDYFQLQQQGKHFYIFDRYVIKPNLYYINLRLQGKDIEVVLNGDKLGNFQEPNKPTEIGPFLPGIYKLIATQETKYITLTDEVELLLYKDIYNDASLNVSGNYVHIESNKPTAKLYVNGKDTGLLVKEATNFGPIPIDGSISLYASIVKEGNEFKSDKEVIDDDYVYLPIDIDEKNKESVPVTIITREVYVNDGFIFPDSHIRLLISSEVAGLSKESLRIARNEIYARNGYVFKSQDLRDYFYQTDWYFEDYSYSGDLTEIEKYNVELIKSFE